MPHDMVGQPEESQVHAGTSVLSHLPRGDFRVALNLVPMDLKRVVVL